MDEGRESVSELVREGQDRDIEKLASKRTERALTYNVKNFLPHAPITYDPRKGREILIQGGGRKIFACLFSNYW